MNKFMWALAAALAFATAPAMAADQGFYVGAGVGQFGLDADVDDEEVEDFLDDEVFDENDTGFRIFGGYSLNKYFSVEAGYDSGADTNKTFGDVATIGEELELDLSVDAFDAYLVGNLPIGESFFAFGKVGLIAWNVDADLTYRTDDGEGTVTEERESANDDGTDFAFGAGFGMNVGDNAKVTAEYNFYDFDEVDGEFISLNFIWQFN